MAQNVTNLNFTATFTPAPLRGPSVVLCFGHQLLKPIQFSSGNSDSNSMDLPAECIDRWNEYNGNEKYRLFWEGNFCDNNTYDYGEVTNETMKILVQKCANIFQKLNVGVSGSVLLYLPNIIQLHIATLAAIKIGTSFIPYSAANEDLEDLKKVITEGNTDVIVTVDGFWRGKRLIRTKWILDEAIQQLNMKIRHILVVRHTTPNDGVPPPFKESLGRRPYYAYKIEMQDGRDSWWANHFVNATAVECKLSNPDRSAAMLRPVWVDENISLLSHQSQEIHQYTNRLAPLVKSNGICFVASYSDASLSVTVALSVLFSGSQLLIFEGDGRHPDYSRIAQIIDIYKVEKLIISEKDLLALIDHPEYLRMWNTKSLKNTLIIGSDRYNETMTTIFNTPCTNVVVF